MPVGKRAVAVIFSLSGKNTTSLGADARADLGLIPTHGITYWPTKLPSLVSLVPVAANVQSSHAMYQVVSKLSSIVVSSATLLLTPSHVSLSSPYVITGLPLSGYAMYQGGREDMQRITAGNLFRPDGDLPLRLDNIP